MSHHGILAICEASARTNLNLAFAAIGLGPDVMTTRITDEAPATTSSVATHYGMYNAAALAGDALLYDQAKLGFLPNEDVNGAPIFWGEGELIDEPTAVAAFQAMQFWLNSSDMEPIDFEAAIMGQAGLSKIPEEL